MTYVKEEDSKSLMEKDRRRDAIKSKLQRLGDSIAKTKKDCEGKCWKMKHRIWLEIIHFWVTPFRFMSSNILLIIGLERLVKTYSENPSFSNKNNLEETEQLIDEVCFSYSNRSILKILFDIFLYKFPSIVLNAFSLLDVYRPLWNWTFLKQLIANSPAHWLNWRENLRLCIDSVPV